MNQKLITIINILICLLLVVGAVLSVLFFSEPKQEEPPARPISDEHDLNWAFFLINSDNPLPEDYEPDLKPVVGDFLLDERCADYAIEMLFVAEQDGVRLHVASAYRSRQRQGETFINYVERLIREDYSASEAMAITATQIAMPGASEHNAGLALDLISEDWFIYNDDYTEDFDKTPEFRWLAENSWRFGFILRYPKGQEETTGFIYEPWHYRFVGHEKAEEIYISGLTLEEFIGSAEN